MNEEPMQYLYGWKWNPRKRQVVDELSEQDARLSFDRGPQLGVVALPQGSEVPAYALELSAEARDVVVTHYTEGGSVAARMHYRTLPEDAVRLFLEDVSEWLYPDDGAFYSLTRAVAYRSYAFCPDGTVEVRSRLAGADADRVEQFRDVDVSDHWHDQVSWGDWEPIGTHRPTGPAPGS